MGNKIKDLRMVLVTGGEYKGRNGYCHGIFQYGNLEYGLEAYMIVELSDGKLIREPIEYVNFKND